MTLLVRDEVDIISNNIEFHLNAGIDDIVVTDNGSVDGTRDILAGFESQGLIKVIDEPGRDFSQWKWVTRMNLFAQDQLQADWIINNDADEFWVAKHDTLKLVLSAVREDIVLCERINMTYPHDIHIPRFHWSHDIVFRPSHPNKIQVPRDFLTEPLSDPYFCFSLPGKAALRAGGITSVHQGNHGANFKNDKKVGHADIEIYHFPVRSKDQFRKKVTQGGKAYDLNTELDPRTGWHWRRWNYMLNELGIDAAIADAIPGNNYISKSLNNGSMVEDFSFKDIAKF